MPNTDPCQIITPLVLVGLGLGVGEGLGLGNQIAISTRGVIIWQGVENGHNKAIPFRDLYTMSNILKSILWCTGSQCRERKIGVMWSRFRVPMSSLAAAF